LRAGVKSISAVLWTHIHNDHIIGLDDIRPYSDRQGYIDGYGDAPTLQRLEEVFDYIFVQGRSHPGFPRVTPHVIEPGRQLSFGALQVRPLRIFHGSRPILSYQFEHEGKRLVYATDCSQIPDESLQVMQGCEVFIVDALRHAAHPNHFSLGQALQAAKTVGARQSYFTHITHGLGHAATEKELPEGVHLAHDGLTLEIP
jgi:phosphoribosyl 1,2-cyclic phosphate phosphodiesterase